MCSCVRICVHNLKHYRNTAFDCHNEIFVFFAFIVCLLSFVSQEKRKLIIPVADFQHLSPLLCTYMQHNHCSNLYLNRRTHDSTQPASVCFLRRSPCHNVYAPTGAGAFLSYLFRWQLIKRVYVARQ